MYLNFLSICRGLCNRHSAWLLFQWKHLVIIWPLKYNLDPPQVMSIHLVPHLPRMVRWEQRTTVLHKQTHRHYGSLYINVVLLRLSPHLAERLDIRYYIIPYILYTYYIYYILYILYIFIYTLHIYILYILIFHLDSF